MQIYLELEQADTMGNREPFGVVFRLLERGGKEGREFSLISLVLSKILFV